MRKENQQKKTHMDDEEGKPAKKAHTAEEEGKPATKTTHG